MTENTTYYVRAYATNSYGTSYGEEFQFITDSKNVSVTLIKPREGDIVWGTVTIKAVARATKAVGYSHSRGPKIVKVAFYIDDTKIAEDLKTPYKTNWDTTSYPDGSYTVKAVAYNTNNESSQDSVIVTVNNSSPPAPTITTNRDRLFFRAVPFGKKDFLFTRPQLLLIKNSGSYKVKWTISTDTGWLSTSPRWGKGSHVVIVFANPNGKDAGTYSASLNIIDRDTSNVLVTVAVQMTVYESNASQPPFGAMNVPMDGVLVNNNVPITGWALDDIEVTGVKIYRAPVANEGSSHIYIGEATLLEGARPDMEVTHPDFPLNYQAGWGYLLNTNSLPKQGNGTFILYAEATDKEGNTVTLGSKTITIDNANGVKPFGAIDTLTVEETAEGSNVVSFGWALTPQPNTIPIDGSTITVWVDGLPVGNPVYNQYRKDIAASFPGYNNRDGAGGYFSLDTSSLTYGVHTMAWLVEDNAGNSDPISYQYFPIENIETPVMTDSTGMTFTSLEQLENIETLHMEPVFFKKGYSPTGETGVLFLNEKGIGTVTINELEPIELELGENIAAATGYLVTGNRLRDLPIGSTLDPKSGRFSWLPGPGYFGKYLLVFVLEDTDGLYTWTRVQVTIEPKFKK